MQRSCVQCSAVFEITQDDLALLAKLAPVFGGRKFEIPPPTLCPNCRQQRRLLWRNERSLYRRTCDLCGKSMISVYSEDKPFTVYCTDCWWSDRWDAFAFGREFDFSRPFFEQFKELKRSVPHVSLIFMSNENAEYTNFSSSNKDSYLLFASDYNEGCLYGTEVIKSIGCVDTLDCFESQYCYEVIDTEKSHHLSFSKDCSNCADSFFLSDCRGCMDCFLCTNQRNKRYCVRNSEVSKEEYAKEKKELLRRLQAGEITSLQEEFSALDRRSIHRAASHTNCEQVSGDYLKNSRNLHRCFDVSYGQDSAHVFTAFQVKDLMDVCHVTEAELSYESMSIGFGTHHSLWSHASWPASHDTLYCDMVKSSGHCFGCNGLKHAQYCVFNKQYTKEEYERMVAKIIDHMRTTGEFGEFFPESLAPFAYNETTAQEYYPLSGAEARKRGFTWREAKEEKLQVSKTISSSKLPSSIDDVPDDILSWAITCEATGRPFRLVKQELDFYREHRLPVPHFHPDERHRRRMMQRNPRKLWNRTCGKCGKGIETTYAPERPEIVYCENCYLKEVY